MKGAKCGGKFWLLNSHCNALRLGLLAVGLTVGRITHAQTSDSTQPPSPPPYRLVRYDEDYRYLQDPKRRTDFLDAVKYIPFDPMVTGGSR